MALAGQREKREEVVVVPELPGLCGGGLVLGVEGGHAAQDGVAPADDDVLAVAVGTVTVSSVLGATGVKRRPRAAWVRAGDALGVAARASGAAAETAAVPVAVAAVATTAARRAARRLRTPATASSAYSLELVLGTSWKQASPRR